jgi:hypothetical protein
VFALDAMHSRLMQSLLSPHGVYSPADGRRAEDVTVDYEWRLRLLMAEKGMFKATETCSHGWPSTASSCPRRRSGGWSPAAPSA